MRDDVRGNDVALQRAAAVPGRILDLFAHLGALLKMVLRNCKLEVETSSQQIFRVLCDV